MREVEDKGLIEAQFKKYLVRAILIACQSRQTQSNCKCSKILIALEAILQMLKNFDP